MRWMLCLLAVWLAVGAAAQAQEQPPGWIADPRTGCRIWNNYPQDDERITWDGPCVNGMAHGRGVLRWFVDDENYETAAGEFREGKLNGQAIVQHESGTFEGEFSDNKPNGEGTLRSSDGEVYSGTWKNGCFEQDGRRAYFFSTPEECGFPAEPGRSI